MASWIIPTLIIIPGNLIKARAFSALASTCKPTPIKSLFLPQKRAHNKSYRKQRAESTIKTLKTSLVPKVHTIGSSYLCAHITFSPCGGMQRLSEMALMRPRRFWALVTTTEAFCAKITLGSCISPCRFASGLKVQANERGLRSGGSNISSRRNHLPHFPSVSVTFPTYLNVKVNNPSLKIFRKCFCSC